MKTLLRHSLRAADWRPASAMPFQHVWIHSARSLQVIESLGDWEDGREWYHVSCTVHTGARQFALPTWDDMAFVKATFIGDEHVAYQVFPRRSEWVSINDWVLHLWHCPEEEDMLPRFGRYGTI